MGKKKETIPRVKLERSVLSEKIPCGKCGVWVHRDYIADHPPCNGKDTWGQPIPPRK